MLVEVNPGRWNLRARESAFLKMIGFHFVHVLKANAESSMIPTRSLEPISRFRQTYELKRSLLLAFVGGAQSVL